MKFLLVDDDEVVLALLAESLNVLGYKDLTLVTSGQDAIELIKSNSSRYDVILLDIQMPGLDGIQVCRFISGQSDFRFTPIIMVTAMNDRSYVKRAFAAGATDYITKPFDLFEIGSRIQRGIELGKAKRRAELENRNVQHFELQNTTTRLPEFASTCKSIVAAAEELQAKGRKFWIISSRIENIQSLAVDLRTAELAGIYLAIQKALGYQLESKRIVGGQVLFGTSVFLGSGPMPHVDHYLQSSIEGAVNSGVFYEAAPTNAFVQVTIGLPISSSDFSIYNAEKDILAISISHRHQSTPIVSTHPPGSLPQRKCAG